MATAPSNGRLKKLKAPRANGNGLANGAANGHANGHTKGRADKPSFATRPQRKQRSTAAALTSVVGRLLTWYLIITLAFRCPTSLTQVEDASPRVCKPYLQARSYATPYLNPYYQTYLAPHVAKVKPYADRFERQVYTPAAAFTKDKYDTYGAHRVEQARSQVVAGWDKAVRPHLQTAQVKVQDQYDAYLGAHVKKASDAAAPYYAQSRETLNTAYHSSILPAYETSLPYLRKARVQGHYLVADVIFPNVHAAKDVTWAFLARNVWPQLRILYGDNVEPQLVRISERLGRYRDQQKMESAADAAGSETSTIATQSTESTKISASSTASPSSTADAGWGVLDGLLGAVSSDPSEPSTSSVTTSDKDVETAEPKLTPEELKERLNDDLRKWQTKFAVAADKGAEDLELRVSEITERQVENGVNGHGHALILQLEETADSTITHLKSFIKKTVESIPENSSEEELEAIHDKCSSKARELGLQVKDKAQEVRAWKTSYDHETDLLVQAAVRSTVEVLERIHGLGLQEVGMRWAWTDGVTYKDWQNYHKLKNTLTEWQGEVEAVGARHEGLRIAHEAAKSLEDNAMTIAARVVTELVRLKDVSKWKIWTGDATDDFSNKAAPRHVFKDVQQVMENTEEVSSQASAAVVGSETPLSDSIASSVDSAYSEASSGISSVSSVASSIVSSEASSASSEVSPDASEISSSASGAVIGFETPVSESAESALSSASSGASEMADEATEAIDTEAASPTESVKKVFGGAYAQVINKAREPILDDLIDDDDDDETYSAKLQSMVADAGERASDLSKVVSEALLGPTKTQGGIGSATSLASEQYAKAIAAASSVLYGTEKQPIESATSAAAEKYAQAVTAASYAIYGTPVPTAVIQTVQVEMSSRYNEAVRLASEQFKNAKSHLSVLASGTPQPAYQTLLSGFEKAYSDSVSAANEQLQAALKYTESAKSYAAGPTQGYFESVSSIASSRLSEGLSQASAQFAARPTDSPLDGARRQYYEAIGLAHGRYSEFVDAASSAVYGPQQGTIESLASVASVSAASIASDVSGSAKSVASDAQKAAESVASQISSGVIGSETPWSESVVSQASENWEALIAKASNQVYGQPTPWAASIYSQAGSYGAQATEAAAQQYADVHALISELVVGKEPDYTESVMSRLSSAYYTALPAAVSSAESYANEQYESASSLAGEGFGVASEYAADAYASASSAVSSVFTPPAAIETIISQASAQMDEAYESASIAIYGTPKGAAEQASESVASAYSSMQAQVSELVYGTQQAQDNLNAAASSAQAAISEAIFGTPTATGYAAAVTSGVGEAYSSAASVASENADYAYSKVSGAIYGPKQGAMESANVRIAAAVESVNSRISEMYSSASLGAGDAASSVESVVADATQRVKDEL